MNNFRPRLYDKDKDQLWAYFCSHSGYNEEMNVYQCAGIASSDTRDLWLKLIEEWKRDITQRAKEVLLYEKA